MDLEKVMPIAHEIKAFCERLFGNLNHAFAYSDNAKVAIHEIARPT